MAVVLGINAVFHDPAAALVVDGRIVAAAEEERFSRRKHGKTPVPFSTWELPEEAARWCLAEAGLAPTDVDAVTYSYDPSMCPAPDGDITCDGWEPLRTLYAERAGRFLATALPGLSPDVLTHVPHHVAHAASAYLAGPAPDCAVLVLDGRGECHSHLSGRVRAGNLEVLAAQALPHSIGLLYEAVTDHLGFRRSSDEYKVMALASYAKPAFAAEFERAVYADGNGGFRTEPIDLESLVPRRAAGEPMTERHAELAASVQARVEEVILDLARWLHGATGDGTIVLAGGVALNCVSNGRLAAEGPFGQVWVQPAAGDAGTALGGALHRAHELGDTVQPMTTASLGRSWSDDEVEDVLRTARVPYRRSPDVAREVAEALAGDAIVAWFQGRSEWGPRALGHRSLLADPRRPENLERLNDVKGREQFRPVAPMILLDRAADVFDGVVPSPYMLFVHDVRADWVDRVPAVVHVDGTARAQTVDPAEEPLMAAVLQEFDRLTGVPVLVNTSLNTAGRPMVDSPRDALECFGSGPVDVLAIGPFLVERTR
jgi:carbamoyltransferase